MTTEAILDLHSAFRSFGYFMTADPVDGQEALFTATMRETLAKVESTLAYINRRDGTRNKSNRALTNLHRALPNPAWGVEVAL